MRKGTADSHRRAEVSRAANGRYLQALAPADGTAALGEPAAKPRQPVNRDGRRGGRSTRWLPATPN